MALETKKRSLKQGSPNFSSISRYIGSKNHADFVSKNIQPPYRCEKIDVNLFESLLNKRLLKFYFDLMNSRYTIVKNLLYYFMLSSLYFRVTMIFENSYSIVGLCRNEKIASLSRVDFVERNEPRSNRIYRVSQKSCPSRFHQ